MPPAALTRSPTPRPSVGAVGRDEVGKAVATGLLALGLANGNAVPELLTVLAAVSLVLLGRGRAVAPALRIMAPVLALVALGGVVTVLTGTLGWDSLRATYYVLRLPIWLGLGIALVLQFRDVRVPLNALMLASVGLSIYFIWLYVTSPDIVAQGRYILRSELAGGWVILPLAALAAGYAALTQPRISGVRLLMLGAVIVLALLTIVLSQSRTALVTGLIAVIAMVGLLPTRFYALGVTPAIYGFLFLLTTPFLSMLFSVDVVGLLDYSAPSALREILALDRTNQGEVNMFWRGYETFTAFTFVEGQGPWSTVFGTGLHSIVPLRDLMVLQGSTYAGIPVFHSLYSFAFVRGGLLGVVLVGAAYVALALPLQKLAASPVRELRLLGRLGCGVHLAVLVSVPTTAGFLNQGEGGSTPLVLLGVVVGCWMLVAPGEGAARAANRPGRRG